MKLNQLLVGTLLFVCTITFGQDYNLPPGDVMKSKFKINTELSERFLVVLNSSSKQNLDNNFLYFFSNEEMNELKINSPEKHKYYLEAQDFYNTIDNRVKNLYSKKELWEIYMYDLELLNKIKSFK